MAYYMDLAISPRIWNSPGLICTRTHPHYWQYSRSHRAIPLELSSPVSI